MKCFNLRLWDKGVKICFDIWNIPTTQKIKRLYYYSVTVFDFIYRKFSATLIYLRIPVLWN